MECRRVGRNLSKRTNYDNYGAEFDVLRLKIVRLKSTSQIKFYLARRKDIIELFFNTCIRFELNIRRKADEHYNNG